MSGLRFLVGEWDEMYSSAERAVERADALGSYVVCYIDQDGPLEMQDYFIHARVHLDTGEVHVETGPNYMTGDLGSGWPGRNYGEISQDDIRFYGESAGACGIHRDAAIEKARSLVRHGRAERAKKKAYAEAMREETAKAHANFSWNPYGMWGDENKKREAQRLGQEAYDREMQASA